LQKEAQARIKINHLLESAGWRFFDLDGQPANIQLELHTKLTQKDVDAFGEDFESIHKGFVDFLLLDDRGFPLVVLEAKREEKNPLDGKEQARAYAQALNVRFVILSNGNLHYFWDLARGNPEVITDFPSPDSLIHRQTFKPDNHRLADFEVKEDFIALSQNPHFKEDPRYINEKTRAEFIASEGLRLLRPYQLAAVRALQIAASRGSDRYLFEMATGTGKTLVSAAIIKLFLQTGNARRVLFLVDRLELEDQAFKNFVKYLKNDYHSVIYKHNRDDWRKAEIVITTVQSLTSQDKFRRHFSPVDFDLVISDEAHRSINGNTRAVFEYFVGYKLGLTATPKDYLKHIDLDKLAGNDPRAWERRQLLDTYTTFGCAAGEPTYRYSLLDGVRDGFLINPIAVDARTDITAELLSEKGYAVMVESEEGGESEQPFYHTDFERRFFSERTNRVFCQAILENALRDPLSGEVGKTIVFCVSQNHASKITQILNELAHQAWPDRYHSDFAVQVTSNVPGSQGMSINFSNNNLNGHTRWLPGYKTSKTRVCVTVGMMTTGYDCQDILNLALLRPVFSPTDFVQIKGRGTRKFTFMMKDEHGQEHRQEKSHYKFFDFFANFEYFEEKFNYDDCIKLPVELRDKLPRDQQDGIYVESVGEIEVFNPDKLKNITETAIGLEGMRVDRELFERARLVIQQDAEVKNAVENEQWERAVRLLRDKYEDKPELFLSLEKLRRSQNLDRRLTWREFLERVFGLIDEFPARDQLLEGEVAKFVAIHKPESRYIPYIRNYIKSYLADENFRRIINDKYFSDLAVYPGFSLRDLEALNGWREVIPEYIKDYVPVNQYMN
jgi:type I restriction enzyme R subunit